MGQNTYHTNFKGNKKQMNSKLRGKYKDKEKRKLLLSNKERKMDIETTKSEMREFNSKMLIRRIEKRKS